MEIQFQTYERGTFHYLIMKSFSRHWNALMQTLP